MKLYSSAYEVNFIGLRSYIHRATKLTSFFTPTFEPNLRAITKSVLLHEKSTCPRTAFHPERIPRPSRRMGDGFLASPKRAGWGAHARNGHFRLSCAIYIYNKEKIASQS